jgi:hypothetical protein
MSSCACMRRVGRNGTRRRRVNERTALGTSEKCGPRVSNWIQLAEAFVDASVSSYSCCTAQTLCEVESLLILCCVSTPDWSVSFSVSYLIGWCVVPKRQKRCLSPFHEACFWPTASS